MTAIPMEEEDLLTDPIYINMKKRIHVDDTISEKDIQSQVLKLIYAGEQDEADEMLYGLSRKRKWDKNFQFYLLVAFFFAIHYKQINLVNKLMIYDIYMR